MNVLIRKDNPREEGLLSWDDTVRIPQITSRGKSRTVEVAHMIKEINFFLLFKTLNEKYSLGGYS